MSTTPTFSPQLIGQTEKTLNAILDRQLAGTGLTEPLWVTLTLTVMGGSTSRDELVGRVAGALHIGTAEALDRVTKLADDRLLRISRDDVPSVTLTDRGKQLYAEIRGAVTEITERLWGDLPADDLAVAGRLLSIVLERANVELANG